MVNDDLNAGATGNNSEITPLLRFLNIIWRRRKFLLYANISVAVLALIVSLLLPQYYEGRLVFIINEESSLAGGLAGSLLESAVPFGLLGGLGDQEVDRYINYLSSFTIIDKVDSAHQLFEYYESDYRKKFYKDVMGDAEFVDNGDNTVAIKFYYEEDPAKAAAIAQSFYDELDTLLRKLARENHRRMRIFLEGSYDKTFNQLTEAEEALSRFQIETRIFSIDKQIELLVNNIAELESKKFLLKIQQEYLRGVGATNSTEYRGNIKQIAAVEKYIESLKQNSDEVDVPLLKLPEKGLEFLRLYREVKIREKILEFIIPQLENVRFEEQRANSNVQILDPAMPQDYKAKPKRITIIFVTCFFFLIASVFYVLVRESYDQNRQLVQRVFQDKKL